MAVRKLSFKRAILSLCSIVFGKWINENQSHAAFDRAVSYGTMCQMPMRDPLDSYREYEDFVCINDWLQYLMTAFSVLSIAMTEQFADIVDQIITSLRRVGIMLCLRALFVSLLTFPPSMRTCQCASAPYNECLGSIYCTDLGFSGHTASNTVVWVGLLQSKARGELKIIGSLLVAMCYVSSVVTRDHYTFDVVVGALSGVAYSCFDSSVCRPITKRNIMYSRTSKHSIHCRS
jgi:hypothetical protein